MRKEKKRKEKKRKEKGREGEGKGLTGPKTFVPVVNTTRYIYSHLYRVSHPVQMYLLISPHLYWRTCTSLITGTN
jgi:hypothetical protein